MLKKIKKRSMTLLEIMVVIFIIGIIGSVVGYNLKGSLKKGKQFKTDQAAAKLREVLTLETELNGKNPKDVLDHLEETVAESGMVKDPKSLLVDGFGERFKVTYSNGEYYVYSKNISKKQDS